MRKYHFLLILSCIFLGDLIAQEVYFVDGEDTIQLDFLSWEMDSLEDDNSLKYFYNELLEEGYWDHRLDSLNLVGSDWFGYGELGSQYSYESIDVHNRVLEFSGKNAAYFDRIPLKNRRRFVLNHYHDHGYPFASVFFDSMSVHDYIVKARVNVQENGLQTIDSLAIKTKSRFSKKVLSEMIHFSKGQVYNASGINQISSILDQYSFLKSTSEPRMLFTPDRNVLYVYLEEESAHYFDGLLGFSSDEKGEVLFRGKLEFKLENAFHRGEELYMKWDAQGDVYQSLKTHVSFPFVISSWGAEANLNIHKQDSSFVKTDYGLGVQYNWKSYWKLGLGLERSESSITKNKIVSSDMLSSFEKTLYYADVQFQKLDRLFQSRSGLKGSILLKAGTREERDLTESEYFIGVNMASFFPIKSSFSIKTRLQYKHLISEGLSDNNLIFLGGSQSMRGFLENQFRFSSYLILSPSLRYHFAENYMLELFTDQGLTYHPFDGALDSKHIWSTGLQIEMPIKSGWLYLGYAVGKQGDTPFKASEGVVHFGLRNQF